MDFAFEALGDEKFQKFCQTILVKSFPNVQCLPVGQPDGGRDAVSRHEGGFIVFQVKFSRNPSLKDERDAIASVVTSERTKVEHLVKRGATTYYLLTNVAGTAHLDSGSIDRVNNALSETFGIPCFVWWRDDLERRLEADKHILWRFPDLARGSDFLEFLAHERATQSSAQGARTFAAYMLTQHTKEADVKFQQVQIQSNLLDLFTDTPIGHAREKMPSRHALAMSESEHQALELTFQRRRHSFFDQGDTSLLAANWLLAAAPERGLQRIVLEGAPGQGKSTVTQYLCQLHRSVGLRKAADESRIATQHRNYTLRLPIRVDLRDYALWLTGKDPLASEKGVLRPTGSAESLESLISYQVHTFSGGKAFGLDDLSNILRDSHCILVLDGFDEVADNSTRSKLIEQIRFTSERMAADCVSLQVIVTSRPAAFILSPGFPERDWAHLTLLPMRREQIINYTDKWISARGVDLKEAKGFKDLLLDRVNRPHIRSLAQNPMQLAILLNLISTKGMSLPDKRTALYDSYMDLFFGREAEKDETVRENRDVLLQIHQYVAWILQLDAEVPGGTGSISQTDLQKLVATFLEEKEHKGDVLKLFTGAVERVGALVSRVQGLLEFEVQPLREYFAGKFLYETAPYSPPGAERHGTKPERFAALAHRPYWSNVIRFYAGCYSSGELLSLVAGLEELGESSKFSLKIHSLQLAVLFLGDHVFAQEPKTVRKIIEFVTSGDSLRYLLAFRAAWTEGRLSLPEQCGRMEIARKAFNAFSSASKADYLSRLGALIRVNSTFQERWDYWLSLGWDGSKKLTAAKALGLFEDVSAKRIPDLIGEVSDGGTAALISCGNWDLLDLDQRVSGLNAFVNDLPQSDNLRAYHSTFITEDRDLFRVYILLSPYTFTFLAFDRQSDVSLATMLQRFGLLGFEPMSEDTSKLDERGLNDIVRACNRVVQFSIQDWATRLTPWTDLIESARRKWGDTPCIIALAGISAGIKSKDVRASGFSALLDRSLPLAERARHARLRTSTGWWASHLEAASISSDRLLVLALLFAWAPGAVMVSLSDNLALALKALSTEEWNTLFVTVSLIVNITFESQRPLSGIAESTLNKFGSERLQLALLLRLPRALSRKLLISLMQPGSLSDEVGLRYMSGLGVEEALKEPKLWPAITSFYRESSLRPDDMRYGDIFDVNMFYDQPDKMAASIAMQVTANPSHFPMRVLEAVESVYSKEVDDDLSTLGKVAEEEYWFTA